MFTYSYFILAVSLPCRALPQSETSRVFMSRDCNCAADWMYQTSPDCTTWCIYRSMTASVTRQQSWDNLGVAIIVCQVFMTSDRWWWWIENVLCMHSHIPVCGKYVIRGWVFDSIEYPFCKVNIVKHRSRWLPQLVIYMYFKNFAQNTRVQHFRLISHRNDLRICESCAWSVRWWITLHHSLLQRKCIQKWN